MTVKDRPAAAPEAGVAVAAGGRESGGEKGRRLRVLFIIKPEMGAGAELVLAEAAARLNPARYEVQCGLLSPDRDQVIPPQLPTFDFNLPGLNGLVWVRFFLHLAWRLYKEPVDILHVNSYIPGNYARAAAYLAGVPVIIDHWHGFARFNDKRRMICRLLGRVTTLSLAVSERVREHVTAKCNLAPGRVKVLANGVDVGRIDQARDKETVRRDLGLPPEGPVVGLVARMDHWGKGHREFLTALAELKTRQPVAALLIGGGRREEEVRQVVKDLGLTHTVHFLGPRRDVPDLLAAMDIFVLPSYSEGVSLALLEAMAAGLPVVATAVGGLPEVVRHGENGLLIPPGDAAALEAALARLLADPEYARHLGETARREVREKFSLERLGQEINEIYGALADKEGW